MPPSAPARATLLGRLVRALHGASRLESPPAAGARRERGGAFAPLDRPARVLVLGIYLADRENLAAEIAAELAKSTCTAVEQRWIALGTSAVAPALERVTVARVVTPTPKFTLVNRLLRDADPARYDCVLVADDDIALPDGFLDRYLDLVARHDLALAQPARTHDSYIDHPIVERLDGLDARRTRFVEIGPVFSIARAAYPVLLPFDESSPMGWGYDFAWPVAVEQAGLRMGIVDATPVQHALRKPVANYDFGTVMGQMKEFLAAHPHLSRDEAFTILEAFA